MGPSFTQPTENQQTGALPNCQVARTLLPYNSVGSTRSKNEPVFVCSLVGQEGLAILQCVSEQKGSINRTRETDKVGAFLTKYHQDPGGRREPTTTAPTTTVVTTTICCTSFEVFFFVATSCSGLNK